jgi:hypothetical protein
VATKKVRRRREKLHRHEYEYVIETEDGDEVPLAEGRPPSTRESERAGSKKVVNARGRVLQKPTIERTLRRSVIFVPLIGVVVFLLGGSLTTSQKLMQAIVMTAVFLPFSHLMDVFIYRTALKRQARAGSDAGSGRTGRKQ